MHDLFAHPEKLITLAKSNWNFDSPDVYFVLGQLYKIIDKWIRALVLYVVREYDAGDSFFIIVIQGEYGSIGDGNGR
jgi:hypothetical protein